jgi:hypothetical protein
LRIKKAFIILFFLHRKKVEWKKEILERGVVTPFRLWTVLGPNKCFQEISIDTFFQLFKKVLQCFSPKADQLCSLDL